MRFAIHTLGCKVNRCDADAFSAELVRLGFKACGFGEAADIYIVNTCTVTHTSDKKSMQFINKARKNNPDGIVAVCGCMVRKDTPTNHPADILFDARKPLDFIQKLEKFTGVPVKELPCSSGHLSKPPVSDYGHHHSIKSKKRTRSFLKIQDGCRQFCSFCIVPYVRGDAVSRKKTVLLEEVKNLIEGGAKEIVLTGINMSAYHCEADFATLLREILETANKTRIRLSSLEPLAVNEDFLEVVRCFDNLCPHFHLPLQSGSDRILGMMNRRYSAREYERTVEKIRVQKPDAAITTDVIVGFPGEDESDFLSTYSLALAVGFSDMHVFEYSKREGTKAATFPMQIERGVKKQRSKKLRDLAKKMKSSYLEKQLHRTLQVLFEGESNKGIFHGFGKEYVRVFAKSGEPLVNMVKNVKIMEAVDDSLIGEIQY